MGDHHGEPIKISAVSMSLHVYTCWHTTTELSWYSVSSSRLLCDSVKELQWSTQYLILMASKDKNKTNLGIVILLLIFHERPSSDTLSQWIIRIEGVWTSACCTISRFSQMLQNLWMILYCLCSEFRTLLTLQTIACDPVLFLHRVRSSLDYIYSFLHNCSPLHM